jgi:hypothetical protein
MNLRLIRTIVATVSHKTLALLSTVFFSWSGEAGSVNRVIWKIILENNRMEGVVKILSRVLVTKTGFGLVIGFINRLQLQTITHDYL